MLRILRAASIVLVMQVQQFAACTPVASACASDGDCSLGTLCVAGGCVPETEAPRGLRIDSIDGDGTELPPTGSVDGAAPAQHRLRDTLVVHGARLSDVVTATLAGTPLTIASADGDTMRLTLTSAVAGLATLVLATGAEEARADVFLLQGEPGPPGVQGEPGNNGANGLNGTNGAAHASLVEPRAAASCNGGVGLAFGVDINDDGVLGASEEDPALARDICPDAVFNCVGGTCTTTAVLDVGGVVINGRAPTLDVETPLTITVPGDFPTVTAALASLSGLRLDADVNINLTADVTEPETIVMTHPEGARIHIVGVGAPVMSFAHDHSGFILNGSQLGSLQGLTLDGASSTVSSGVIVDRGGFIVLNQVTVQGFGNGVLAIRNGTAMIPGSTAQNNVNGFNSLQGGAISSGGVPSSALSNSIVGFNAAFGSVIEADFCTATGSQVGIVSTRGSAIQSVNCQVHSNSVKGISATEEAYILAANSNATNNPGTDVAADNNSVSNCNACVKNDAFSVDGSSIIIP